MELSGFYRSKYLMGGLLMEQMSQVNFGLQKELSKDRGVLKFTFNDIFFNINGCYALYRTPYSDFFP